jgi:hypothetical protein
VSLFVLTPEIENRDEVEVTTERRPPTLLSRTLANLFSFAAVTVK